MATRPKKSIHGVDISYCQTGLDYRKLKDDGIGFVMIRAGYTGTASHKQYADRMCTRHVKGCKEAGLPFGYYWYSGARTVDEAKREALYCAQVIKRFGRPEYPVFFDIEELFISEGGKARTTDICLAFIAQMNTLGYPSGVYTNPDWLENRLDKKRLVGKVDIWLAHWTNSCKCDYGQTIWQSGLRYSAGKQIDSDICYTDYPKKTAEWYAKLDKKAALKPVRVIAREVIDGKWYFGAARKAALTAAGYNYAEVQAEVNKILGSQSKKK